RQDHRYGVAGELRQAGAGENTPGIAEQNIAQTSGGAIRGLFDIRQDAIDGVGGSRAYAVELAQGAAGVPALSGNQVDPSGAHGRPSALSASQVSTVPPQVTPAPNATISTRSPLLRRPSACAFASA